MEDGGASSSGAVESKAGFVLGNVAEVVERILTFVPTKSVFRFARMNTDISTVVYTITEALHINMIKNKQLKSSALNDGNCNKE
ncbi:F-box only protein 22 [Tachysurus ichikawai]